MKTHWLVPLFLLAALSIPKAPSFSQNPPPQGIGDNYFPLFSPDGTHLAFTSARDGNREIYLMDRDGSNQTRLTHHAAFDGSVSWSPDGEQIAFVSDRSGYKEIYLMEADGSRVTQITHQPDGELTALIRREDLDRGLQAYRAQRRTAPEALLFSEGAMAALLGEYAAREQYEEALALAQLNVDTFPNSATTHFGLGQAYARVGQARQARPHYEASLTLNHTNLAAVDSLGFASSLALFEGLGADQRHQGALNGLGRRLLNRGQTEEALAIFKLNATAFPNSADVYKSLADAYVQAGDKEREIQNYERVLSLKPGDLDATERLHALRQ